MPGPGLMEGDNCLLPSLKRGASATSGLFRAHVYGACCFNLGSAMWFAQSDLRRLTATTQAQDVGNDVRGI